MKRVFAWLLLLTMALGMFAGCKKAEVETTQPQVTQPQASEPAPTQPSVQGPGAKDAMEYVQSLYQDGGKETPVDFNRYGIVRVGGIEFAIEWSVDVGEELVKVVKNEDGTYTIDINEQCEEATPYQLTATITYNGETATYTWNYILPKAQDMVEIVKAAYALGVGESLPYESRLIGKIISIDSIWSDDYQNISVTIEIEGAEDMPIKCYRMKSSESTVALIKDLKVGNIVTVLGTLKNYEGTIEFDAGCILEKVEKGDAVDAPTDPGEILKAAYALAQDKALPYQATLTGTVTQIDSPYDPAYGNISVVIVVEGYEKYPMLCYRLKGTGVDQIAINDLITVTGIIKNYKGTIEYDAGCIMTNRVSGGGVAQGPSSDAAKILADAAKLGVGEKLPYRATLTGEVYSVDNAYDPNYGNVTVTIKVNGVKIQCYRMVGDGIDQIRETDTITVSGVIENYNGKLEFGAKCTLDSWSKGPRNVNYGPVDEDVAYRLYMDQAGVNKTVYFDGSHAVSSSGTVRLNTVTKGSAGADVFAERVSGKGVRFYYMDGQTKTYIEIEEYTNSEGKQRGNVKITTSPSCYWVYNKDTGVYVVNLPTAGKYFLGTYSTYETITASWIGYIDGTMSGSAQYVAKFIEADKVPADGPAIGGGNGVLVTNPQAGVPYKWGIEQENKGVDLYFTGTMSGYYGATSESIHSGVDVILEEVPGGGYYITFKDANGAKKYVVVTRNDTHINFTIASSASTVYTYNTQYNTLVTEFEGKTYYMGTYGTYMTFSVSSFDKIGSSFPSHFYTVGEGGEEPTPSEPVGPSTSVVDPEVGSTYKFGMVQGNVGTDVYYITGEKNGYYMDTTTDAAAAADVYLEAANGGYYLCVNVNGAKKYINMVVNGTHVNGEFENSASTIYTYDADKQTVVATIDGALYWFGTRNDKTFTTIGPVKVEYDGFYAQFYSETEGEEPTPSEPVGPSTSVVDPEIGSTYKFGMVQGNVGTDVYYITGEKNGYYMDTTTDAAAAADVYLEAANGGYYLCVNVNGAKKYINMVVNGTHVNGEFENSASTIYTYDADKQTVVATIDGALYWFGTRNDKTFTTIGPVKVEYDGFYAQFYGETEGEEPTPSDPTVPEESEPAGQVPTYVTSVEAGTVYKLGLVQGSVNNTLLLFNGEVANTYYGGSTENWDEAVDVVLEATDGGYYLSYTKADGTKMYVNVVVSGKFNNFTMEQTASSVYTFDEEYDTLVTEVEGKVCYLGTYNTFKTFSASTYDKITSATSYPSHLYVMGEGQEPEETEPQETEPQETEPVVPGDGFNKVTSADQLTSGQYVMIVSTGYAPGVFENGWLSAVQPAVSGNTVTDPAGAVWTLTVNGSSVTITDSNGVVIMPKGGNSNGVLEGDYEWDWSFANGTFKFAGTGSDTVVLASNATTTGQYPGNHRFRGYKTTTVNGQPENYPCAFTLYKLGGEYVEPEVTEPQVTEPQETEPSTGTGVETGKAYKWAIDQENKGVTLYFAGTMNGYYGATTENADEAVDVVLEAANGGYYISFTDPSGAKKYINVVVKVEGTKTHRNFTIADAPASVYTYSAEHNTLLTDVEGTTCYIGTYGNYNTFSVSSIDKIATSFPSYFVGVGGGQQPSEPTEPEATQPGTSEGIQTGKAYKWAIDQENKGVTLYFAGTMNGYYGATTENADEAVDVVLEAANGGYYISFTDASGAKKYINVVVKVEGTKTHRNFTIADAPASIYTYSAEHNTLLTDVEGTTCYIGTYGNYNTFSVSPIDKIATSFPSYFVGVGGGQQPSEPTEPEATAPGGDVVTEIETGKAYKWAIDQQNKGVTLYFAGTMSGYYGATTENMEEGVDVVLEAANGGYYISFTDPSGAKKYINVVVKVDGTKTHRNFTIADAPASIYTYSAEHNTLLTDVEGTTCYIGTYGTYNTFSVSPLDKIATSFPSYFVGVGGGQPSEPTEPETTEPEATEPSAGNTVTYKFSDYAKGVQYNDEVHELDSIVTMSITGCHLNTQLRIYQDDKYDGNAVFASTKAVQSLVINAGHKAASLEVYGSSDGQNWVLIQSIDTNTTYGDYIVEMPEAYKYLKLDAVGAQIRVPSITFEFAD